MRTLLILLTGFLLLGFFLLVARWAGGRGATKSAYARAAFLFIPAWFGVAAWNLWLGVARAGYTVAEELPIFLLILGLPAVAAFLLRRRLA